MTSYKWHMALGHAYENDTFAGSVWRIIRARIRQSTCMQKEAASSHNAPLLDSICCKGHALRLGAKSGTVGLMISHWQLERHRLMMHESSQTGLGA